MLGAGALLAGPITAFAQQDDDDTETDDDATETEAPGGWVADALDELVTAGTLTQAQADAVAEALEAARPERPFGGGKHWRGGPEVWASGAIGLDAAAEVIGIEEDDLRDALRDGTTLAELADAERRRRPGRHRRPRRRSQRAHRPTSSRTAASTAAEVSPTRAPRLTDAHHHPRRRRLPHRRRPRRRQRRRVHVDHSVATTASDRRDDGVHRALERDELHLGDAPDEPSDRRRRRRRDRCRVRRPRVCGAPGGRRSRAPTAARGWRCRTGPGRSRGARPRAGGRGRRTPRRTRSSNTRRSHSDSARLRRCVRAARIRRNRRDPRATGRAESLGDALQRRRRAEPPGEGVLDHRCQRHVVDVAGHVDDGPRRAGQPDAVGSLDDVVVGQRRRAEHADPRLAARVAAGRRDDVDETVARCCGAAPTAARRSARRRRGGAGSCTAPRTVTTRRRRHRANR